jgi:hypothetical protein
MDSPLVKTRVELTLYAPILYWSGARHWEYKLSKLASKLADAITLLELVIELDLMYYGDNSAVMEEDRRLCLQLKEGYIP